MRSGIWRLRPATSCAPAIDDDVWCLGDDARILQIGRALATNAMTHTPAGTTVTLRARRRSDRAELSVEDDGPGIPETQQEAVFARFYRVEGGMASGSGLGLAIAREIAESWAEMSGSTPRGSRRDSRSTCPAEPIPPGAPRSAQAVFT